MPRDKLETIQHRLRWWREERAGVSLRKLQELLNDVLPEEHRISFNTLANYERPEPSGAVKPGPRAEILAGLKTLYPDLRLEWLVTGEGPRTLGEEKLMDKSREALATLDAAGHPGLSRLSSAQRAVLLEALARYVSGVKQGSELLESEDSAELLAQLAADFLWLVLLPLRTTRPAVWGFQRNLSSEDLHRYLTAMIHALELATPGQGEGDSVADYRDSLIPTLRKALGDSTGLPAQIATQVGERLREILAEGSSTEGHPREPAGSQEIEE
jgi:hypothetical protein